MVPAFPLKNHQNRMHSVILSISESHAFPVKNRMHSSKSRALSVKTVLKIACISCLKLLNRHALRGYLTLFRVSSFAKPECDNGWQHDPRSGEAAPTHYIYSLTHRKECYIVMIVKVYNNHDFYRGT